MRCCNQGGLCKDTAGVSVLCINESLEVGLAVLQPSGEDKVGRLGGRRRTCIDSWALFAVSLNRYVFTVD